ncbi:MAG: fluoride efflux transporter CrcB [Planctomycetota bacterium]
MIWLAVAAGGALGAVARFGVAACVGPCPPATFPWSTLFVNVVGCFAIGLLLAFAEGARFGDQARAFLVTGLIGSFTTFSTFGFESIALFERGRVGLALVYVVGSIIVGFGALLAGRALVG